MAQLGTSHRLGVTAGDARWCCKAAGEAQMRAPVGRHHARRKSSPALKHGAYSEAVLLPGEDPAEFRRLHRDLIEEFSPTGRLEEETVAALARLVWRRQNLARFEIGQFVNLIALSIENTPSEETTLPRSKEDFLADFKELDQATQRMEKEKESRESSMDLLEVTSKVVLNRLTKELDVEDRLDMMIDRQIKRLSHLKGLKSIMSSAATTYSTASHQKDVQGDRSLV
jgi:hypothetical protein